SRGICTPSAPGSLGSNIACDEAEVSHGVFTFPVLRSAGGPSGRCGGGLAVLSPRPLGTPGRRPAGPGTRGVRVLRERLPVVAFLGQQAAYLGQLPPLCLPRRRARVGPRALGDPGLHHHPRTLSTRAGPAARKGEGLVERTQAVGAHRGTARVPGGD